MATLLKDDMGMPVPQVFDKSKGSFSMLDGTDGVQKVNVTNLPNDGKYPCVLIDANGLPIPVTNGLYVYMTNEALNSNVFNGEVYVPNQNNVSLKLADKTTHPLYSKYAVQNVSSTNMIIKLAGNGVTAINILVMIGDEEFLYDTIQTELTDFQFIEYGKTGKLLPANFLLQVMAPASVPYALGVDLV